MTIQPTRLTQADPDLLLRVALRTAAAGYPVFPCAPDAKHPITEHGLLDATTDPDQIRAWWRRTPTANLAIPTGITSFDVLDVDVRPTGTGYPAYNTLVRTGFIEGHSHLVVTPSGGLHAYFIGTDQRSSSLPALHLDFKATGGYVLAPPSVVAGRPYELQRRSDQGPHRALNWAAARDTLVPPQSLSPAWPTEAKGIEPLASWVSRLPEGRRNSGTFWAACRAVEQGITDLRPLVEAAITSGLPKTEAMRTISSAIRHTRSELPTPPTRAGPTQARPRR
jgi:hypothetical protein